MAQSTSIQRLFERSEQTGISEFGVHTNSNARLPTAEAYGEWQGAFDYFNERLFGNALPDCLITFTRRSSVLGYFCAGAFRDEDGIVAHEIAMNPVWFALQGVTGCYQTLCHEMCHLHRHLNGRANRKGGRGAPGYHDAVWADQMEAIGLKPSDTGAPGGRRTGYRVSDYVIEGGDFDIACRELLIGGQTIKWHDNRANYASQNQGGANDPNTTTATGARKNTRTRFVCGACDVKAWSRASARLACCDCNQPLIAQ